MAGTFTRQSMAPNAMRRQAQQAGGPVQLVDDLVDDQPPPAMQARTSPQRGLSYIEIVRCVFGVVVVCVSPC